MAWTTPSTAVAGSVLASALWNTDVRDNTTELRSSPPYRCVAFDASGQTVNSGATDVLLLDSEDVDTAAMHNGAGANPELIAIPTGGDGTYLIHGRSVFDGGANNPTGHLHLQVNSTSVLSDRTTPASNPTHGCVLSLTAILDLEGGDTLNLAGQAASANATFGSSDAKLATRLSVLGPMPWA